LARDGTNFVRPGRGWRLQVYAFQRVHRVPLAGDRPDLRSIGSATRSPPGLATVRAACLCLSRVRVGRLAAPWSPAPLPFLPLAYRRRKIQRLRETSAWPPSRPSTRPPRLP